MTQRHPNNPNLHLFWGNSFNSMEVQSNCLPMVREYLQKLDVTLQRALADYPRVLAFRVDPIIPDDIGNRMTLEDHRALIPRFFGSLKSIIEHDRKRKRRNGWVADTKVRYVWCREFATSGKPHYHFFLILNRDAYHRPGKVCSPNENLLNRVSRAWHSALGVEWNRQTPLIYVPDHPWYWVDRDDEESFRMAFHRASYMCKADSKQYGQGLRAFDSSQI